MKDELMVDFIHEETDQSFARWRWFCIDHGERSGSYANFIGRLHRCRQALDRHRGATTIAGQASERRQRAQGS